MKRLSTALAALTVVFRRVMLRAADSSARRASDVVIKNAMVMTVTHGNIKNGSIYIKDGKIARVGENVTAPAGTRRLTRAANI